jgi:hypothetical protein
LVSNGDRADHPRQEPQDRQAQPVIAFGQLGMGAIGGEQELGEVVGADRQERQARRQHIEAFGQRRHFQHGAIADRLGQHFAA